MSAAGIVVKSFRNSQTHYYVLFQGQFQSIAYESTCVAAPTLILDGNTNSLFSL